MLRDSGWLVAVVERWNPHARLRQDLFGFGDLLAVKGNLVALIQTTSGSNVSARIAKIRANPSAAIWLGMGNENRRIVVHGWRKAGPRGKRKTWQCRMVRLWPSGEADITELI